MRLRVLPVICGLLLSGAADGPFRAQQSCPCVGCDRGVETVTPCDPNEKIGPGGFGDARYVRALNGSYTISSRIKRRPPFRPKESLSRTMFPLTWMEPQFS